MSLVLIAVFVQQSWLTWIVSHWGRFAERDGGLISYVAVTAAALAASWFTGRWIRRLPADATIARVDAGTAISQERAASTACGFAAALIAWGLVAAHVIDDLQNGRGLGSPYMYMIAAPAGVAAA